MVGFNAAVGANTGLTGIQKPGAADRSPLAEMTANNLREIAGNRAEPRTKVDTYRAEPFQNNCTQVTQFHNSNSSDTTAWFDANCRIAAASYQAGTPAAKLDDLKNLFGLIAVELGKDVSANEPPEGSGGPNQSMLQLYQNLGANSSKGPKYQFHQATLANALKEFEKMNLSPADIKNALSQTMVENQTLWDFLPNAIRTRLDAAPAPSAQSNAAAPAPSQAPALAPPPAAIAFPTTSAPFPVTIMAPPASAAPAGPNPPTFATATSDSPTIPDFAKPFDDYMGKLIEGRSAGADDEAVLTQQFIELLSGERPKRAAAIIDLLETKLTSFATKLRPDNIKNSQRYYEPSVFLTDLKKLLPAATLSGSQSASSSAATSPAGSPTGSQGSSFAPLESRPLGF